MLETHPGPYEHISLVPCSRFGSFVILPKRLIGRSIGDVVIPFVRRVRAVIFPISRDGGTHTVANYLRAAAREVDKSHRRR